MNQPSTVPAITDGVQIVSTARTELMGLLDLARADFDGIPRSGFDTPTALEFQGLLTRWSELAEQLIGTLTGFEDALRAAAPQAAGLLGRGEPRDPGNIDPGLVLARLEGALRTLEPHWPDAVRQRYAQARGAWAAARDGLAFVREQIDYLVLGVGSDA